jgi:hypothetical protein
LHASTASSAASRSSDSGFSLNTGRPAVAACTVSGACVAGGVAIATASLRSSSSSNEAVHGTAGSAATRAATPASASWT